MSRTSLSGRRLKGKGTGDFGRVRSDLAPKFSSDPFRTPATQLVSHLQVTRAKPDVKTYREATQKPTREPPDLVNEQAALEPFPSELFYDCHSLFINSDDNNQIVIT